MDLHDLLKGSRIQATGRSMRLIPDQLWFARHASFDLEFSPLGSKRKLLTVHRETLLLLTLKPEMADVRPLDASEIQELFSVLDVNDFLIRPSINGCDVIGRIMTWIRLIEPDQIYFERTHND